MNSKNGKDLIILAGPNGAGKSTVASFLLKNKSIQAFLNADIIASGMSSQGGKGDIRAGRVMLKSLHGALEQGRSVAFETTMSGKSWFQLITGAQARGYEVTLCYVAVDSVEIATERVRQRVLQGGHAIPEETIRRRYSKSIRLFFGSYSKLVNHWYFFDNSKDKAVLVALSEQGKGEKIIHPEIMNGYNRRNIEAD